MSNQEVIEVEAIPIEDSASIDQLAALTEDERTEIYVEKTKEAINNQQDKRVTPQLKALAIRQNAHLPATDNLKIHVDALKMQISNTMDATTRVRVEQSAKVAQTAAKELGLFELEKEFALLIQDCKRVQVAQNPPMGNEERAKKGGKKGGRGREKIASAQTGRKLSSSVKRCREAHNHMTDQEWEERKAKNLADPDELPLTQTKLIDEGIKKRNAADGGQRKTNAQVQKDIRQAKQQYIIVIKRGDHVPALGGITRITRDQFATEGHQGHAPSEWEQVAVVYRKRASEESGKGSEETLPMFQEEA